MWKKASYSAAGNCIEVDAGPTIVRVRDTKDPDGLMLEIPRADWEDFLAGVKAGVLDEAR